LEEEEKQAFRELQARLADSNKNNAILQQSSTMFQDENQDNLIKWQLDIERELVRIERLLRKQVPTRDKEGNIYFKDVQSDQQIFNENGINSIMNKLAWYVNKNIILSCYTVEEVNLIMKEFSYMLIDFIYINANEFGMDTPEKKKYYTSVCMDIINIVDATYRRAIGGGERESLKTARIVNQTEPLGGQQMFANKNRKPFNVLNYKTWT
jgi:hypothetical protein